MRLFEPSFSVPRFSFLCLSLRKQKDDVLVMKNGDRFTCEIKGLSAGVLSVKLSYVDGTISVQWSQVAHLESERLFRVQTESGAVYTGKLSTTGASNDPPITVEVVATPKKEVEVAQRKIVRMSQTSESFWHRFDGAVNTGSLYSKGNQSFQYNLSSDVTYSRERWSSQVNFNSSFASNSGAKLTTRNQEDISTMRLLRWNNWFCAGSGSLPAKFGAGDQFADYSRCRSWTLFEKYQSVEHILVGGLGWQNVGYAQGSGNPGSQNTAVAFVASEIKVFKFKKTNLDISASLVPAISEPGRLHFNANAVYYIKIISDLSWNFSFYGSWDNRPPATLPGSDYGTSSGLSWTLWQ